MTYFPTTRITFADTEARDAFGRLRVGDPRVLFDSKQVIDDQVGTHWAVKVVGSAQSVHSASRASSIMTVAPASGSRAVRQSRMRMVYQPGKSQQAIMTALFGPSSAGINKRVGYFDGSNGLFFADMSGSFGVVTRHALSGSANVRETFVTQSSWNIDRLDGSGPSGITLNRNRAQILMIDFEWLGVGRTRFSVGHSGSFVVAHSIDHANADDSVYMSTPNLPVRYEIESLGGAPASSSLEAICATVVSEGGFQTDGALFAADRGASLVANVSGTNAAPLISVRLDRGKLGAGVFVSGLTVAAATTGSFRWGLFLNPAIGGTDAASWVGVSGSAAQQDISRNITNFVSGGIKLASGYANGQTVVTVTETGLATTLGLGSSVDGDPDEIVLAVQKIGGGTDTFVGGLSWREFA